MPTLKSVKSLSDRVLRGAPLTLRTRYRPPSSSPEPSSILVFSPVLRPRHLNHPPSSSPEPSSVPSPSFVLHPRLRNCSPFSFSALFTGVVSVTVLHPRFRNRPQSRLPPSSSILVFGTVLHSRFQPCSPDSSPEPFSVPSPSPFSAALFFGCN